uniref:Uncharacterized protein n=1 Tax=Oryza nivara TaxID=4536 RepID=A0A0E0H6F1_ORYNI
MAMTLRFPAGGATSVPAAMPHRVPMATAPSRLPATVAMALISTPSAAIRLTPINSATHFDVLRLRARRTDGEDDVSALPEIDGAASALPCTASTASPRSCVPGFPNTQSAFPNTRLSLLGWILKLVQERFSGDPSLLSSLLVLLIGGWQTAYFKEAVERRIKGSMRIPPCILTIFTFCAAVATLLYKAVKASEELDGIISHLIKKFEKLLESHDVKTQSEKLPEPREAEAKSQAKEVKTQDKLGTGNAATNMMHYRSNWAANVEQVNRNSM